MYVPVALQIQNGKWLGTQLSGELKSTEYSATLTLGNVDLVNSSGSVVKHSQNRLSILTWFLPHSKQYSTGLYHYKILMFKNVIHIQYF